MGFSKYLKSKKKLINTLIEKLKVKYPFVSVLGTDVEGYRVGVDRFSLNLTPSSISEAGFCIKVYDNGVYSEYSVNDINNKNINEIIENIDYLTKQPRCAENVKVSILEEEVLTKKFTRKPKGKLFTKEEIIETLKNYVSEAFLDNDKLINVSVGIEVTEISKMYMSTSKDLEQYYTWSSANTFALVREGSNTKYAYDGFGSNNVEQNLIDLKECLKKTISLAEELLSSTVPTPGIYDVITDPSITGLIAHEAFGHGVEMDMFVKDRAQAKEYMGQKVASPLVSMHDGAIATLSAASYFFDDDGVLAHDTKIIDKGILISGISDALSALELGTIPTGNGRRQSYKRKAYTRMTNTFFEKGNSNLADMIKSIDYGYMIYQTNNGMEDPKNWGIQCTAHYGREIVNGEFTGKIISPVVMSGHVIDLLNSISAVSKDFKVIGSGSCGKGYKEWVRVSDGGACLKAKVKIG